MGVSVVGAKVKEEAVPEVEGSAMHDHEGAERPETTDLPTAGPAPVRIAVAFHSGYGHTARQAAAVADGAREVPGTAAELLSVDQLDDALWSSLDAADAIVFGAPTYMGSPSATFKVFAEGTSGVMQDNLRWQDKIAAGFTNSSGMSGDKLNTLVDLAMLAAQHGMIWVGLARPAGWAATTGSAEDLNRLGSWLGAMAQSDADVGADIAPPPTDLRTARDPRASGGGRHRCLPPRGWPTGTRCDPRRAGAIRGPSGAGRSRPRRERLGIPGVTGPPGGRHPRLSPDRRDRRRQRTRRPRQRATARQGKEASWRWSTDAWERPD